MGKTFQVKNHILVPKHTKLSAKEKKEVFERYSLELRDLPRVLITDPAIQHLGVEEGDIIKIVRTSPTAGKSMFYRRVASD